jgi:hypothetical protein
MVYPFSLWVYALPFKPAEDTPLFISYTTFLYSSRVVALWQVLSVKTLSSEMV